MTQRATLVGILIAAVFITGLLYVIFGQVTVRKLRKNPKTKDALGFEYVSGWDIVNVAQALSLPRAWTRKLEKSPLSPIYANSEVLFNHTTKTDRILGAIFYWLLMSSGLSGMLLVLLDFLGFFQD